MRFAKAAAVVALSCVAFAVPGVAVADVPVTGCEIGHTGIEGGYVKCPGNTSYRVKIVCQARKGIGERVGYGAWSSNWAKSHVQCSRSFRLKSMEVDR